MTVAAIHTVPHGEGWANTREGSDQPIEVYRTEFEAENAGREMAIAAGSEHVIHTLDGQVCERHRYNGSETTSGELGNDIW